MSATVQTANPIRIVVIDNDVLLLRSLEMILKGFGFDTTAFEFPVAAVEWIREHGADIVVCDICMPECDGFEVLRRLKAIDASCELIFITAHGQLDMAVRALREGAADFFEKPFTSASLLAAIERTNRYRNLSKQKELLAHQVNALSHSLIVGADRRAAMIGSSPAMIKIAQDVVDFAATSATVLILGESGTGKELIAHAVHQASNRSAGPFVTVNCPSIPADLFESEMFGHRRGSFTGAVETRTGLVDAADGGTLFLDEIGDMPAPLQAKLLRLLEQKTYLPVGESKERSVDVRVVAATNQDLNQLVQQKRFREDLYYRLHVCSIVLPPLRERKEDIPLLALYFTLQFASDTGKAIEGIEDECLAVLSHYDYHGNIRELRNIVESSVIRCKHAGNLTVADLPTHFPRATPGAEPRSPVAAGGGANPTFEAVERRLYEETLGRAGNNVSAAARLLGLSRGKLRRRLAALKINASG